MARRRRRRGAGWLGLLRALPLLLAVLVGGGAAWYHLAFDGFTLRGNVLDAASGAPLAGARVVSARGVASTGVDGTFALSGFKPPEAVSIEAPGYRPASTRPAFGADGVALSLEPVTLALRVRDAETGEPVATATAIAGTRSATQLTAGELQFTPVLPSERIVVTAAGYLPRELTYAGEPVAEVSLSPSLVGRITDRATGKGMGGVPLKTPFGSIVTETDGTYRLPRRSAEGTVEALVPGYRRGRLDLAGARGLDLALEPLEVRALYLTYFAIGHPDFRQRMFQLLETTELNAVVIDVKGDPGLLAYRSRVPLAEQIGANDNPTVSDIEAVLAELRARGVYTIARLVIFKDNLLSRNGHRAGLDVAIKNARTGGPWIDLEGLGWVDPFQTAAWDYNIALAREAIERGFDEVQFDYIRFPTDPAPGSSLEDTRYSRPFNEANRVEALRTFLGRARVAINEVGGFLGIDTYGYTTWWEDDGGIGQDIAALADHVDYVCFMIYPSTYNAGLPGSFNYPEVVRRPYEVVYESLQRVKPRMEGKRAVVRPWIQYFDDYPWATAMRYEAPQIEAQKRAVRDAGARGWMLWDPFNLYNRGGLAPRRS